MRWLTNFYDFRFKGTATAAIRIHPASLPQLVNFKNAIRKKCHRNLWNSSDCFWSILHQFLSGIRDSRMAGSLWGMIRGVGGVRKSIHQSWLAKGLGLRLVCWGFKGVHEEIPSEEANTIQIGSVAFPLGQCTNAQLHPCPRLASRQFYTLPIVQTFLPVTFGYSLSSEAVVMRQLRRLKKLCWRSLTLPHKKTSMGSSNKCIAAGGDYFEGD